MDCMNCSFLFNKKFAEVAELAYAQVSEACASRLEGSNPSFRIFYGHNIAKGTE